MQVSLACADTPAALLVAAQGIAVHKLPISPGGMNPFRDFVLYSALRRLYKATRYHIIHHVTIKPVLYGGVAARLIGRGSVVNALSGLGYLFTSGTVKARAIRNAIRGPLSISLNNPRSVLLLQNPDDADLLTKSKLVKPDRIRLIRGSGVDTEVFRFTHERESDVRVVFPARLLLDIGYS